MPRLLRSPGFWICALVLALAFGFLGSRGIWDPDEGRYYYDRYALPYVKAYAPPNTAPGTYEQSDDGEYWRGSHNDY